MKDRDRKIVFVGVKGSAIGLDRESGREVWRTRLKGSDFVNLVVDGGDLFATARGEVFCLDPASGRIRWKNPLRGLGWGLVTVATAGGSSQVAVQYRFQQEQAAAAAARSNQLAMG